MKRYKSEQGKRLIMDSYDELLASWETEFHELDIDTTYGRTHLILAGDHSNEPLLLFHGTADNSAMMWIYNIKELCKSFYIIAVDAVGGSGKSEPNEAYFTSFNQVTWIDEILAALKLQQVNICGVSYGAYLSYYYTLMRPDKVNKAICLAGRIPSSQFEVMYKMITAFMPEAMFPSENNCRKLLKKLSGPNYSVFANNEVLMNHWYYLLKYFNNQSMMKHKIVIHSNEEIINLKEKVIFIIGEHDRLSNYPSAINRLKENNMNYIIVEDAGHAINHEQAHIINEKIIEYIL